MMVEHTNVPSRRGIPRVEYQQFSEHREPSANVRIWLASYSGANAVALALPFGIDVGVDRLPARERGERHVWGSTILFGPVVFQILGSDVPGVLGLFDLAAPNTQQSTTTKTFMSGSYHRRRDTISGRLLFALATVLRLRGCRSGRPGDLSAGSWGGSTSGRAGAQGATVIAPVRVVCQPTGDLQRAGAYDGVDRFAGPSQRDLGAALERPRRRWSSGT